LPSTDFGPFFCFSFSFFFPGISSLVHHYQFYSTWIARFHDQERENQASTVALLSSSS